MRIMYIYIRICLSIMSSKFINLLIEIQQHISMKITSKTSIAIVFIDMFNVPRLFYLFFFLNSCVHALSGISNKCKNCNDRILRW